MPIYDYHCEENNRVLEVRHNMADKFQTWGELCEYLQIEIGNTSPNAEVKKIITGGHLKVINELPRFDETILPK